MTTSLAAYNNTNVSFHRSVGQKSRVTWWHSLLWVLQGWNHAINQLASYWETLGRIHFQAHWGCWYNSVPFSCGTEVPESLLAVSWGLPSHPGGLSLVLVQGTLYPRAINRASNSHAWNLCLPLYHISLPPLPLHFSDSR